MDIVRRFTPRMVWSLTGKLQMLPLIAQLSATRHRYRLLASRDACNYHRFNFG